MLLEIDRGLLHDAIKAQDLSNADCKSLGYDRDKLADAALRVVQEGFDDLVLGKTEIRGSTAFTIRSTPHLVVLRCLNQTIRQAVGIQPSDRDTIIRRLTTILTEGVPHRLYKFDIKKFFDSVGVIDLFADLANEPRIPRKAIWVLNNYVYMLKQRGIEGLPRGIQLSATMAEYAMRRFDRFVSRLPEVYYYARYVDDIVVVTGAREQQVQFKRQLARMLPRGLRFNGVKTRHIDIPVQHKSDGSAIVGDVDYLGYNFSIHETKRVDQRYCREIDVTLAPKKVRRLKSRICRAVAGYIVDGNEWRLERRLQLLTGNYNLRDMSTGKLRNVGLYCNYRRANSRKALVELDTFMRAIFVGNKIPLSRRLSTKMDDKARRSFLRFSFSAGFRDQIFYNFPPDELAELALCWRDA
ncbi:antiviral reverse transcriptase Drt3a [Bradyrhizobium sp. NAS96.2]|uniref:antiviral reverse transcriptase Drt3a n=1 Tax=Bradyrhizobium sp. NAS96.2 TaxID=1680160 RepID=UPI0009605794|nr:antiviral reverse transcriptase Drt3a [Bradyrhizobium sp. NAS96.2]OKO69735.1 hypothetical protein AC628_32445 [Bradyrhizobium sp. NAS96.2]